MIFDPLSTLLCLVAGVIGVFIFDRIWPPERLVLPVLTRDQRMGQAMTIGIFVAWVGFPFYLARITGSEISTGIDVTKVATSYFVYWLPFALGAGIGRWLRRQ